MNNGIIYRLDWLLIVVYLLLVSFGIINVYSATYSEILEGVFDVSQPVGKQVFLVLVFLLESLFFQLIVNSLNNLL